MKKTAKILSISFLFIFLTTANSIGMPIDATTLNLTELQGVFTAIGSSIDANDDETQNEVFGFQSTGATAQYVATVSYTASNLEFGLYESGNVSNMLTLFDTALAGSLPGDDTQVYIDYNPGANIIKSYTLAGGYTAIDTTTFGGSTFGIYVTSGYGTYYSESDLNDSGADKFLTYMGKGEYVTLPGIGTPLNDLAHWYIASEATNADYNEIGSDFTDFVVQIESMQPAPVPIPTAVLLLGSGLIGYAGIRRRKFI